MWSLFFHVAPVEKWWNTIFCADYSEYAHVPSEEVLLSMDIRV